MLHKGDKLLLTRSRPSFPCCSYLLNVAQDKLTVLGNWRKSPVNIGLPMHTCVLFVECSNVPKQAVFWNRASEWDPEKTPNHLCIKKETIISITVFAQHLLLCKSHLESQLRLQCWSVGSSEDWDLSVAPDKTAGASPPSAKHNLRPAGNFRVVFCSLRPPNL